MDKVTKNDWPIKPMSKHISVSWYHEFKLEDLARLNLGFKPIDMDDRWFIYMEDNTIFFHRSWSGICIFILHVNMVTNEHTLYINDNPEEYTGSPEQSISILKGIISNYLLESKDNIPVNKMHVSVLNPLYRSNISLIIGDITTAKVDCIVNAANSSLLGGGGVDGAIHRAAGPELLDECKTLGGCPVGEAVITKGYNLPARYIIHTVGPIYSGQDSDAVFLRNCYINSLNLARNKNIHSIAFPCISTGIYGYPIDKAAKVAIRAISDWFSTNKYDLHIKLYCFDKDNYEMYKTFI